MSRAPTLTNVVVISLEAILDDLKPVDYLGTGKEAGVKYLTALTLHHRSPDNIAKRQKNSEAWRQHKQRAKA